MTPSIFERCGGFAQVNRVVSSFYDKLLDSPVTAAYFEHIDMRRLIDHQTKFVATVMGGPASYTDDALKRVHANLDISERAFQETARLLKETLEDFGLEEADVRYVTSAFMDRKHLIVTRW